MTHWYFWAAWPFVCIGAAYLLSRIPGSNEEIDWFSPGAWKEQMTSERRALPVVAATNGEETVQKAPLLVKPA